MLRSYALTAAAITLRVYLGLIGPLGIPFPVACPAIAWLCWVPNLLVMELHLRRGSSLPMPRRDPGEPAASGFG